MTITKQEIIDHVYPFIMSQGQASNDDGDCYYRSPHGKMCAVGCLLAEDEYRVDMEHNGVFEINLPERLKSHMSLLAELQALHDNWKPCHKKSFQDFFTDNIRMLCERLDLTMPEYKGGA